MQQELEILQGTIGAVIYQNYENGYSVVRLKCADGQAVTVVGTLPQPAVGERLMVTGRWGSHQSHGRQFEAEFLERLMPRTPQEILSYLSSRAIKGVGPVTAGRIVQHFGERSLMILEQDPQRLSEVPGISPAKARTIGEEYRRQVGMRQLMEFFAFHQLPAELAVKCYKLYGEAVIELLYDDPYLLMDEGLEAPFGAVDKFAISLGIAGDDPRRIEAGLLFELRYNLTAGHCFLPKPKLLEATAQLLSVESEAVQEAVSRLVQGEQLLEDTLANIEICYLPELFEAELYTVKRLQELAKKRFPLPRNREALLKNAQQSGGVDYSQQQLEAMEAAMCSGLLLITGGPGTGKTTIVKGILQVLEQLDLKCQLAAPTGRAAKRLTEVTGQEASTIHRLLEAGLDPHTGKTYFARDEENPLKADAYIIDEMSMVDIRLLSSLLRAIPEGKRLILVGDPDQLPPVGPGAPFSDCLRSGALPGIRLTEIFRQAQESLIVMNAHRINHGELPVRGRKTDDYFFLPCATEEEVAQTIAGLCTTRLPEKMGIPSDQIQVLTPTRKGGVGTWGLNGLLQSRLNPPSPQKKERRFADFTFREGDRVMQIKNNYDILWKKTDGSAVGSGIFNGDIGTVTAIDPGAEILRVVFDDRETEYEFSQLHELEPAYAMTVHKSQGSEYRAVVLAAWSGSPYLLSRSVLYTAVTRARELLVIVGREEVLSAMVGNAKVGRRYSGLKLRLQQTA